MALRTIREDGDPLLRKKSRVVEKIDERIITLIEDMIETMKSADGIGLAAPQVGVLKRIIVIDIGEGPLIFINPEISETDGEQTDTEGCLSIPGKVGEVTRPQTLKLRAIDVKGQPIDIDAKDLLARAICHEVDHLDGILFKDKAIKGTFKNAHYDEEEQL